ncbi:hypothetical protein [Microbacterium sp.]|uniref:hypothetical protein n=1 Tax=Microbacterium sp. TaxID=51671 RepID=UPI0039E2B169
MSRQLNEMKVAAQLLQGEVYRHRTDSVGESTEVVALLEDMALIAGRLADAPYLFRDEPVRQIAQIVIAAAGMTDMYGDDEDEVHIVGPRPTKWTVAKAGEVWELTFDNGASRAYIFDGAAFVGEVHPGGGKSIRPDSPGIVAGRRVWMPK